MEEESQVNSQCHVHLILGGVELHTLQISIYTTQQHHSLLLPKLLLSSTTLHYYFSFVIIIRHNTQHNHPKETNPRNKRHPKMCRNKQKIRQRCG